MFSWFRGSSFEEQVQEFDNKINQVATSLIKSVQEDLPNGQYDLTSLQDMNTCNKYVVFLGDELDKRFKKFEIDQISSAIYIGKRQKKTQTNNNNLNSNNYTTSTGSFSKKELCQQISSHYIRIFNLLASILTAVDPNKNMCSRRLEALYQTIETDKDSGYVRTCPSDDLDNSNPLYPKNITDVPGIKHLLNLYYFYLSQDKDSIDKNERSKIKDEFQKLYQAFSEVFVSSDLEPPHMQELEQANQQLKNNLETLNSNSNPNSVAQLTSLVADLKSQIEQFQNQQKNTQNQSEKDSQIIQMKNNIVSTLKQELNTSQDDLKQQLKELQEKVDETTQQQPLNNTQPPLNNTQPPLNNTQQPALNTTQQPLNNTQQALNTTQQPLNNTQQALNTTQQPLNTTQQPLNTTQQPLNNTQPALNNTQQALNNTQPALNNTQQALNNTQPVLNTTQQQPSLNTTPVLSESNSVQASPTLENNLNNNLNNLSNNNLNALLNNTGVNTNSLNIPEMPKKNNTVESTLESTPNATIEKPLQSGGSNNNDKGNNNKGNNKKNNKGSSNPEKFDFGTLEKNQPEEINMVSNEKTMDNSDVSPLNRFLTFVNKYNTEFNISKEYQLNFRPKTVSEIANKYKCSSEASNVIIKLEDSKYNEFKNIYKKMKNHYTSMTDVLLDIAENSLLSNNNGEYQIRSLTSSDLNSLQTKVMKTLTNYYTKCQSYYQDAFEKLSDALLLPENIQNNN